MDTKKDQNVGDDRNNMDKRLEAIKEIIVGNNFERIEDKIGKVNKGITRTNQRVVDLVEQFNDELRKLKQAMVSKIDANDKKSFDDDEEIRDALFTLKRDAKQQIEKLQARDQNLNEALDFLKTETKTQVENLQEEDEQLRNDLNESEKDLQLAHQMLEKDLGNQIEALREETAEQDQLLKKEIEENLQPVLDRHSQKLGKQEELLKNHQEDIDEQEETLQQHTGNLKKLGETTELHTFQLIGLDKEVARIDTLEETLAALREDFSNAFFALSEEVKALKKTDERLYNSLTEEVEDRALDMGQLEARVTNSYGEMKAYLSERSRVFVNRQEKLENRMEGLDDRMLGLHDLLEDEVFKYFEDVKKLKKNNRQQLKTMEEEFYHQLEETMVRMEGRIDGMMEVNRKDMRKLDKKLKNKESLKRTLSRLGDLLDD